MGWAGGIQFEAEADVTLGRIRKYNETTDNEVLFRTVKSETPPGEV